MYPKNEYVRLIEKNLDYLNLKILKHLSIVLILRCLQVKLKCSQITHKEKNLNLRKRMFEDKEDEQSIKELED